MLARSNTRKTAMPRPEEERYTDLLRHLAAPSVIDPAGLGGFTWLVHAKGMPPPLQPYDGPA